MRIAAYQFAVTGDGIFEIAGISVGVRICFEVRFPEYFRELYARKTDLNVVLFYDVSDADDTGRYDLIKGHLQTRAVENVSTIVSVDSIHPYQTAPTAVFGKSGQILKECTRNQPELLIYDFEKTEDDFGEMGRRTISDTLFFEGK
jgi:omega-amidase